MTSHRLWLWASLVLLAIAAAALFGRYQRDIQAAKDRVLAGGTVLQTACGPIEYAERCRGRPVLLVHGAGGGYDQGLLLGEVFGEGFRIIAPSRFGYLRTPVPAELSIEAQSAAHACLLDALQVDNAIVMGVSAGSPSSIEFALRYPERTSALILWVPAAYAPGHEIRLDDRFTSQIVFRIIMAGSDFLYWLAVRSMPQFVVRFIGVPAELYANANPQDRAVIDAIMQSVLPVSRRLPGLQTDARLPPGPRPIDRIRARTLVVSARDDLFNTLPAAQYIAAQVPKAAADRLRYGRPSPRWPRR